MAIGPARMPLMDHLGELRLRLVRILVVLVVGILVFYAAAPVIGQILIWPIKDYLPQSDNGMQLYALTPFESFGTRFKIAFWSAIVATSPMIFWQILAFFLPALKPKERRWFIPTFIAAVILFILGVIFCYTIILKTAFQWLIDQSQGLGDIMPQMSAYIDIIIKFEIGFGIAFQLPLIVFYLVIFGIIPYKKLRSSWRVIYLVLLVFSAIITPDASPVTMLLLFAALIALYEISLTLSRIILAKKIEQEE
ncbi:MAG: twin-arginine translocase subunit TatC [Coriobacteriia bacterium]|nr:twin-arginine translocase subunit TatC [Coriobacteriia bacterium]